MVGTFALYLRELAAERERTGNRDTLGPAFRRRWLPYLTGDAQGPT